MSDVITLWCVVDGDCAPFQVHVHRNSNVDTLKKAIKVEVNHRLKFNALKLILWMLTAAEPVEPESSLARRIRWRGDVETFANQLTVTQTMSALFLEHPLKNHVHILVQVSRSIRPIDDFRLSKRRIQSFPPVSSDLSPRRDTVAALYERLKEYHFIQVRGTPASGKTVLSKLLAKHISQQDPDVHVIWINGWPPMEQGGNYYRYLKQQGWVECEKTVFILDSAQSSYDDLGLWNDFFKSIHEYNGRCRAIAFATYGSPTSRMYVWGILIVIPDHQRVTLRHIDHKDDLPPVGLLFTRREFDDLVANDYPSSEYHFHSSFFDAIFNITNGHVGAFYVFIGIITAHDSYCKHKYTATQYTWDSFLAAVTPCDLLQKLESSSGIFIRGLPSDEILQAPAIAGVFSAVLQKNVVTKGDKTVDESALDECFRNGWLHADMPFEDNTGYFFASSLHRWYMEWKLWDTLPQTQIQANSLLEFVINAIGRFSSRNLSAERRLGPACIQRRPEARYQDELYRCCHIGSLITFPEFGMVEGRADFYIPAKHWGIELLHEGNQLANHCGRFSKQGPYNTSLEPSEYIIVDCRTTRPMEEHPHMSNLYHVVFEDSFKSVRILDVRLHVVSEFCLSAS